ncbi:hypothetical protein AOLI_G00085680 [Acnodon oligacanthus]
MPACREGEELCQIMAVAASSAMNWSQSMNFSNLHHLKSNRTALQFKSSPSPT